MHLFVVVLLLALTSCGAPDRAIMFTALAPGTPESVYEIAANENTPRLIIAGDETSAINLAVKSPNGSQLAFVREFGDSTQLFLADSRGMNPRRVLGAPGSTLTFPDWSPDGQSLLVSAGRSVGQLGVSLVTDTGAAVRSILADSALYRCPSWAPDGKRFVVSRYLDGQSSLLEVELATGTQRVLVHSDSTHMDCPRWSPQGSEIALTVYHGSGRAMWERYPAVEITSSVWVFRPMNATLRRVTPISNVTNYPSWGRHGRWLVFQSDRHAVPIRDAAGWNTRLDSLEIYIVHNSGRDLRRLTHNKHFDAHPSW